MSAQAEDVVASAASLASMADELDAIVVRFRIDASGATTPASLTELRRSRAA